MPVSAISNKESIYSQTPEEQAIWEVCRTLFQDETAKRNTRAEYEAEEGWHSARVIGLAPIFMLIGAGMWCAAGYAGYKIYSCFATQKDPVPLVKVVPKPVVEQPQSIPVVTLPTTLPVKVFAAPAPRKNNNGMEPRN